MPEAVKKRRLREVIDTFNVGAREANREQVRRAARPTGGASRWPLTLRPARSWQEGRHHLLMVEGYSRKSEAEWTGRTDCNRRVVMPRKRVSRSLSASSEVELQPGDYVAVRVTESLSANTLRAEPLARSSIGEFYASELAAKDLYV